MLLCLSGYAVSSQCTPEHPCTWYDHGYISYCKACLVTLTWKHLGGGSLARTCAQAEGMGKAPPGTAFIPTPSDVLLLEMRNICVNNWYTWVDCIGVPEVELGLKGFICLVSGLTMAVSLRSTRLLLLPPPLPPPPPPPPPCDWEVQLPPPWDVCWEAYGKNNETVIKCKWTRIHIILLLKVYSGK